MREFVTGRILGVGLAATLAAVTVALALTGQLDLYINPSSAPFAVSMAVLALLGTIASFALPLGAEADHGHDHGHDQAHDRGHGHGHEQDHAHGHEHHPRRGLSAGGLATATGGVLATATVLAVLITPPASLSAELAMSRDTGTAPLFQGADNVALAATGDTDSFGVGEWASVFATATNPEAFDGDPVALTGFITPGASGASLTRLVITHCVIDAQPASIPLQADDAPATGTWVSVEGTIRSIDGHLRVVPSSISEIDEPKDPYEY